MEYITDLSKEHYNHLKESKSLLVKNFDWKIAHCKNKKDILARVSIIRKIESQLHQFERQFELPRTKHADLSLKAAQKRMHLRDAVMEL